MDKAQLGTSSYPTRTQGPLRRQVSLTRPILERKFNDAHSPQTEEGEENTRNKRVFAESVIYMRNISLVLPFNLVALPRASDLQFDHGGHKRLLVVSIFAEHCLSCVATGNEYSVRLMSSTVPRGS